MSETIAVTHVTFRVTGFVQTVSGFDIQFIRPLDLSHLNLYQGQTSTSMADLVVTGPAGNVNGSLIWEPATNTIRFVKTGGTLAAGTYTITLVSAADAFVDANGEILDGEFVSFLTRSGDGTAGGDYVATATVAATGDRTLSVPDFARGPGQAVDTVYTDYSANPVTDTLIDGLPVRLSDGTGVTSVEFDLVFNPDLLDISTAGVDAIAAGWTVDSLSLAAPGRLHVSLSGPATLGSDAEVVRLNANVPAGAAYGAAEVIRFENLSLNGGSVVGRGDAAVHKVALVGDATGNRGYSGEDSAEIARIVVGYDTGFDHYLLTDPTIVADVTGDGTLSGLDAAFVAAKSVGRTVPAMPDIPAGMTPQAAAASIDPVVSIPSDVTASPGDTVTVPVEIDTAAGVQSVDLVITYDPSRIDLANADVTLGSVPSGWVLMQNVVQADGRIRLTIYHTDPLAGGTGALINIAFHIKPAAAGGTMPIGVSGQLNEGRLIMTAVDGSLDIAEAVAPTVSEVLVAGSGWTTTFFNELDQLGAGTGGFRLDGATPLPWGNIDQVKFRFDSDVNVGIGDLELFGVNTASFSITGFSYDAATHTATWTLAAPFANDRILARVKNTVTDKLTGLPIEGMLAYRFDVLPGDANGDRAVDVRDFMIWNRNKLTAGDWTEGRLQRRPVDGRPRLRRLERQPLHQPCPSPPRPTRWRRWRTRGLLKNGKGQARAAGCSPPSRSRPRLTCWHKARTPLVNPLTKRARFFPGTLRLLMWPKAAQRSRWERSAQAAARADPTHGEAEAPSREPRRGLPG